MGLGSGGLSNVANTSTGYAEELSAQTHTAGRVGEGLGGSTLVSKSGSGGSPSSDFLFMTGAKFLFMSGAEFDFMR